MTMVVMCKLMLSISRRKRHKSNRVLTSHERVTMIVSEKHWVVGLAVGPHLVALALDTVADGVIAVGLEAEAEAVAVVRAAVTAMRAAGVRIDTPAQVGVPVDTQAEVGVAIAVESGDIEVEAAAGVEVAAEIDDEVEASLFFPFSFFLCTNVHIS